MDFMFFFTGGLAAWILILRRELLDDKRTFRTLVWISSALFVIGVVLHFTNLAQRSACGALLAPLISLGLFRICRRVFVKRFSRDAKDTYLNWQGGLGPDRIFNIVYFSLSCLLLMACTIGMVELAKAGW